MDVHGTRLVRTLFTIATGVERGVTHRVHLGPHAVESDLSSEFPEEDSLKRVGSNDDA